MDCGHIKCTLYKDVINLYCVYIDLDQFLIGLLFMYFTYLFTYVYYLFK